MLIDFITTPIRWTAGLVKDNVERGEAFDVRNDGFLFWWQFLCYPWIWMTTDYFSIVQLFTLPIMMFFYVYDRTIFVDEEKSAKDPWGVLSPKEGLPTTFAKMFSIMSLLWGDYTWIEDKNDLSISFKHMLILLWFSWYQVIVSVALEGMFFVWGFFAAFFFGIIIVYETSVMDYSFEEVVLEDDQEFYDGSLTVDDFDDEGA